MKPPERAWLLIADLSGYTSFLAHLPPVAAGAYLDTIDPHIPAERLESMEGRT